VPAGRRSGGCAVPGHTALCDDNAREDTASAGLAELRGLAAPASHGSAVLSHGAEEHAAFSPQAARAAAGLVPGSGY
jgi:hypothetical protein